MPDALDIPTHLGARLELEPDEWLQSAISRWAWKPFGVSRAALLRSFGLSELSDYQLQTMGTSLLPSVARNISIATGISEGRLREATMVALDGKAMLFSGHKQSRDAVWTWQAGTRYCPDCISERPGFFSLYWRLPWVFACLDHHRLLRDTCASCLREPFEMRGRNADVFDPATCRADILDGAASRRLLCRASLGETGGEGRLNPAWRIAEVQEAILANMHRDSLQDLQSAATGLRGARAFDIISELSGVAESELQGLFEDEMHIGISPPKDALAMGALVAAAWSLCHEVDASRTRQIVRRVTFDRRPAAVPRGAGYGAGSTNELIARWGKPRLSFRNRLLRALDADLTVSQRILWDTSRNMDAIEQPDEPLGQRWWPPKEMHVPHHIWPAWCSRMDVGGPVEASALSAALSLVLAQVGRGDYPGARHDLASVLRPNMLGNHKETTLILRTLSRLADSLRIDTPPIDYVRRLSLGRLPLLEADSWSALSDLHRRPGNGEQAFLNARRYLWQRFTGASVSDLPRKLRLGKTRGDSYDYSLFRTRMTAELQQAFDRVATTVLRREGLDEPAVWTPPLLGPIECAGPEIDDIDVERLHELLLSGLVSRRRLSSELRVSERRVMRAIDAFPPPVGGIVSST